MTKSRLLLLFIAIALAACSDSSTSTAGDSGSLPSDAVMCEEIAPAPGTGALDPTGTPAEFREAKAILLDNLDEHIVGIGAGGTSSHVGRITLGLNTRDPKVIQSALDLVEQRLFCFELPPADFDGESPVPAIWSLDGEPDAAATSLTLMVDDPSRDCGHDPRGRILTPVIVETDTEVQITVELTAIPWGFNTCEGWEPVPFDIELSEPLGDRRLTGGE